MSTAMVIICGTMGEALVPGWHRGPPADCWMLAQRDANGNQVANPQKFPNGFKAVADFIHSLNMSSGLYTAKGHSTCAGFAASCEHEAQDALQWASWGIDYVKVRDNGPTLAPSSSYTTLSHVRRMTAVPAAATTTTSTTGPCGRPSRVRVWVQPRQRDHVRGDPG